MFIISMSQKEDRLYCSFSEPVIELSDDQKDQILNSQEFGKFFDKATRLMERALCEDIDIFMDYSGAESEEQDK